MAEFDGATTWVYGVVVVMKTRVVGAKAHAVFSYKTVTPLDFGCWATLCA